MRKERFNRLWTQLGPVIGLVAVVALFWLMCARENISYLSFYNVKLIITHTVIVGIAALGMTVIIVSGGIDLSVGSLVALTTVVTAVVLKQSSAATAGIWLTAAAAAAGIGAAAFCGLCAGLIITRLSVVPFIVTLGMMQIARGLAKWLGENQTVVPPENWLNNLMMVDPTPEWLLFAPGVWLLLGLLVVMSIVLRKTVFGRYVYAIGSSEATARLCGLKVNLHRVVIYTLGGIFAGVAGVMQYANLTVGDPTAAGGLELDVIAAVVIGGGSLKGGEGSAWGTVIGALIMTALRSGCSLLGMQNYVQDIIIGGVIIAAVVLDSLKHRFGGGAAAA